jgi:hypothetical protein
LIGLALVLCGLARAEPVPPVPIPPMSVPAMPAVTVTGAARPTWRVLRPGSHVSRVHFVLDRGRRSAGDGMAFHLLQRVLNEELRSAQAPWRDAGIEVKWSIGAHNSQWVIDGIDGTSIAASSSAVQTLLAPRLRQRTIRRARELWLQDIDQAPRRLNRVHAAAVQQVERGADGPPVRRVRASDVAGLRRSALVAAHRYLIEGGLRGRVVVADRDTEDWVVDTMRTVEASLPAAAAPVASAPTPPGSAEPVRALVDHPAGVLAMITVTAPMVDAADPWPDRFAAAVLGGGFDSRLNRALREAAGLSYAAEASVTGGWVRVRTAVRAADVGRAVAVITAVLDDERAPTEAEIEAVRRGFLRAAAHEMRLSAAVGANFANAMTKGEGPGAVGDRVRAITLLSHSTVMDTAARQLSADQRAWVITGNALEIERLLHAEGWQATHRMDAGTLWPDPERE